MAIEIRELVIKATIRSGTQSGTEEHRPEGESSEEQAQMIQTCVEEVLKIIKDEKER